MKIIVDNKIPYIKEAINQITDEVVYAPGKDFTPEMVKDADALNCYREAASGSSPPPPSASTTSTPHIAARQASPGPMPPDAIPLPWRNTCNPPYCFWNSGKASPCRK